MAESGQNPRSGVAITEVRLQRREATNLTPVAAGGPQDEPPKGSLPSRFHLRRVPLIVLFPPDAPKGKLRRWSAVVAAIVVGSVAILWWVRSASTAAPVQGTPPAVNPVAAPLEPAPAPAPAMQPAAQQVDESPVSTGTGPVPTTVRERTPKRSKSSIEGPAVDEPLRPETVPTQPSLEPSNGASPAPPASSTPGGKKWGL